MTSVVMGLCFVFFLLALVLCLVLGGVYLLARHVYRDYQRQGGAKKVVPQIVIGTASQYAAKAIRKRFLGF